jgi:hypothetical protein
MGCHAAIAATMGPYAQGETTLAAELCGALDTGMLLLADRLFVGAQLWQQAAATGAELARNWRGAGLAGGDRQDRAQAAD